jgi:aromatic ring-opening dioxygenase LigB subunit
MEILGEKLNEAKPDTIVVASPHNLRMWKNIAISFSENSSGQIEREGKPRTSVKLRSKCDVKLAKDLYAKCIARRLPVVGANYGTFEGPTSDLPMDWGTLVPLWFFLQGKKNATTRPMVMIVTPSREIPLKTNADFGRVFAQFANGHDPRIAFVASADQAHAHAKRGPYGFSPAALKYDKIVIDAIEKNDLAPLLRLDMNFVEKAKPDSLWQLAMLQGVLSTVKMESEFLCYDVPTYYGMICASFSLIS